MGYWQDTLQNVYRVEESYLRRPLTEEERKQVARDTLIGIYLGVFLFLLSALAVVLVFVVV